MGTIFEHKVEENTYKVEVKLGTKCQGCVALEGTTMECHKLWAKVGSCFADKRPDKKEVIFKHRRNHFKGEEDETED